jgi:diguanylate cyclase (GGDEF)-like protein
MATTLRWCAMLFGICFAALLLPDKASAATTDLSACFLTAMPGESFEGLLGRHSQFDCKIDQAKLKPGTYWVRLSIPASATTVNKGLVFRTASLWDEGLELWTVRSDGKAEHYRPYKKQEINPLRLGSTVVVPLARGDHPIETIYVKVTNSAAMRGVLQQSQLTTTEDAIRYEMKLAILYSAFAGLCVALLIFNIALWRGMREPFLFAYCGMLVATFTYAFFTSGAPHYVWPEMSGPDRLRLTVPLLAITAASAMIFVRHFFDKANIPGWLVRLTYGHAAWIVAFAIFCSAVAPAYAHLSDPIYVWGFVPLPFIVACYVVTAFRNRDPFLTYFLIAWSGPAISLIIRTLFGLDLLPYNILIENSTMIGMAWEALISSLAIGRRVRLLGQARDRAEIAEARALEMADTDALTGLLNRRAFVRELMAAPRDWQLVLVDIDHFKRVNDTLGHVDGDEVLVRIANAVSANAPEKSLVARLGGEEFAVATLAPFDGSGLADPVRMLEAVRKTEMPGGYRVTASIGIARRVICEEMDWKILYRAADMALYRAKAEGRDRHVDYSAERIAA